ncbi:LacI family transcriptional regulator [Salipaludibacillus keqinensis]|uniref:LacI family transcriptional regulator n=1 Tax=Salipaludibacillus keqinensis TaxID=2045207 RepID=A0A323TC34_9BACI|nr:LacI family DNA-binding transcriptional regulator [Salipaludibacillus keqinensis]PYZ92691.1 LacI family transcriptional regulator [Salipaludibacillus keqinensis]
MATIKDVAKLAGVAVSTASYALNGTKKISDSTKQKVITAAKELNYQKNGYAMDLKMNKTKIIALILSDLIGPFYSELIQGVQEVVMEHGYDLIVCSSYGDESSTAAKFLREKRADGVILFAHNIETQLIQDSVRKGFPIVVLDRDLSDYEDIISVNVNNEHGSYIAAKYLIDQGSKNIAFVSGPKKSIDSQLRLEGFKRALKEHNLPYYSKWNINGKFTKDGGYQATKMLIHQGQLPDAVFYANDEMAIGGIEALKENHIDIPNQVSVIGFDDIQLAPYIQPPLTTVKQPKYEMGKLSSHLIFQVLEGEDVQNFYSLETEMIIRDSVQRSF